jgi:CubicO group peptidase (beta-lactamase class C family)
LWLADYDRADFYRDLRSIVLESAPGSEFSYSNVGAQLAGFILERVYGQPFEMLFDASIARPLGMEASGLTLDAEQLPRLALGYDERGRVMPKDLTAEGAGGGLMSTAAELSRYVRWHLDESVEVVRLSHAWSNDDPGSSGPGLSWHVLESKDGVRRISSDGTVPGFSTRIVFYPDLDIGVVLLTNQLDWSILALTEQLANQILETLNTKTFSPDEAR